MTPVRPLFGPRRASGVATGAVGLLALLALMGASLPVAGSVLPGVPVVADSAVSVEEVGPVPTEVGAGAPTVFAWEALDAQGQRVGTFAVAAELTVTENANGSSAPAWVNASTTGPLARSANGTFAVPSSAWSGGVLSVSVDLAVAVPVTLRLSGPLLPSLPAPALLTVLPDLDHLVLYNATGVHDDLLNASRSYTAFWHVRDRFGDPAPGASLILEYSTNASVNQTMASVVWSTGGTTGVWVNFTAPGSGGGTLAVLDGAGTTVLGPWSVAASGSGLVPSTASGTASLSPLALLAVTLIAVAGVGGIGALLLGGRRRPSTAVTAEEEELRRLAEGRVTVVDMIRRSGPLTLHEIENTWEPSPAPPALADWVASLVTDGTLTAAIGEGGRARFSLAEHQVGAPRVTLDEGALQQGIARRDAALARDDGEDGKVA